MGTGGCCIGADASSWFMVVANLAYIFSGKCGHAWSGFSCKASQNLWGFVQLSFASAVMICSNICAWTFMVSFGLNVAVSIRVSNELGAGHPRTAKISMIVASFTSLLLGIFLALVLLVFRSKFPPLFTNSKEVQMVVHELTPLLAVTVFINSLQPALSGEAIGAGWQAYVAYVNIACYYLFGLPIGLTLGFLFNMGVNGIWFGMLGGTSLQTAVLIAMVLRTNWNKEASLAGDRIKQWGGDSVAKAIDAS